MTNGWLDLQSKKENNIEILLTLSKSLILLIRFFILEFVQVWIRLFTYPLLFYDPWPQGQDMFDETIFPLPKQHPRLLILGNATGTFW